METSVALVRVVFIDHFNGREAFLCGGEQALQQRLDSAFAMGWKLVGAPSRTDHIGFLGDIYPDTPFLQGVAF